MILDMQYVLLPEELNDQRGQKLPKMVDGWCKPQSCPSSLNLEYSKFI